MRISVHLRSRFRGDEARKQKEEGLLASYGCIQRIEMGSSSDVEAVKLPFSICLSLGLTVLLNVAGELGDAGLDACNA